MVAVTRPLADSLADAADPQLWLAGLAPQYSPAEFALVEKAFHAARALYQGHRLAHTQEDMFSHAVAAAAIVADLNLLADAVMAALLFAAPDLREDSEAWLSQEFNPVVAGLVLGGSRVRKIQELGSQHDAATPEARSRQAEAMRQMLLAMVADIRVVLIKLAWRTQTMYHLSKVPDDAVRRRVARETLDIFAPLANRLGVWQIKWELEDLAFRHLEPDTYKKIAKLLDERRLDRLSYIEQVLATLRNELAGAGLHADVAGRPCTSTASGKRCAKKTWIFPSCTISALCAFWWIRTRTATPRWG